MFRRSPDFWSGLALVALGVYIVTATSGWDYLSPEGPGPAFFPRGYGIAMIVLAAALMVGSAKGASVEWRGTGPALGGWAAIAAGPLFLETGGFLVGFAVLCPFFAAGG